MVFASCGLKLRVQSISIFDFWLFTHFFFSAEESHLSMTICPRRRAEFGIRWSRSKVRCSVPPEIMAALLTATAN